MVAIWYYYHMVTKLRYLYLEEIEPSAFWTLTQVLSPGLQWSKLLGYWGLTIVISLNLSFRSQNKNININKNEKEK